MSVEDVAVILGISRSLAYRLIRTTGKLGPLSPVKLGRTLRFGQAQVDAVLAGEESA